MSRFRRRSTTERSTDATAGSTAGRGDSAARALAPRAPGRRGTAAADATRSTSGCSGEAPATGPWRSRGRWTTTPSSVARRVRSGRITRPGRRRARGTPARGRGAMRGGGVGPAARTAAAMRCSRVSARRRGGRPRDAAPRARRTSSARYHAARARRAAGGLPRHQPVVLGGVVLECWKFHTLPGGRRGRERERHPELGRGSSRIPDGPAQRRIPPRWGVSCGRCSRRSGRRTGRRRRRGSTPRRRRRRSRRRRRP